MLRYLFIEEQAPRKVDQLLANFAEGFVIPRAFGILGIAIASILIISFLFSKSSSLKWIVAAILLIFGVSLLRFTAKKVQNRKRVFQTGELVHAEVASQGSYFNILKLAKDYYVDVIPANSETVLRIAHTNPHIHKSAKVGGQIQGLYLEGRYFFGEEVGGQFNTKKIKKNENGK